MSPQPILKPSTFPCALKEAPPGPFLYAGRLCHRTDFERPNGTVLAYHETGEQWALGDDVLVQPVRVEAP